MSSLVIKIIALISMIIDHTGAMFFPDKILFRLIGRLAMPLFAFQYAVGLKHTSNFKKRLLKTLIFAIIVQIPYAIFELKSFGSADLNIIFTFFLASLVVFITNSIPTRDEETGKIKISNLLSVIILSLAICALPLGTLETDYGIYGVLLTLVFYYFMDKKNIIMLLFPLLTFLEAYIFPNTISILGIFSIVDLLFIYNFNGKKGYKHDNVFYIIYFMHFVVLCLIKYFLPT
jgi:hypothetical protein